MGPGDPDALPRRGARRSTAIVRRAARSHPSDGIIAVGDRPAVLAARVERGLRPAGQPADGGAREPQQAREPASAAGGGPAGARVSPAAARRRSRGPSSRRVAYPAVIKPLALSGSRGVIRVDRRRRVRRGVRAAARAAGAADVRVERDAAHDTLLVESFIPGREYAVEGVLTAGALRVFAIFDKPDPLEARSSRRRSTSRRRASRGRPATRSPTAVAAAARALGLRHGPCTPSAASTTAGVLRARGRGAADRRAVLARARFVSPTAAAASLEEVLLRHALGEDVAGCVAGSRGVGRDDDSDSAARHLPRRRRRGAGAGASPDVDDVRITAKPDTMLVPLPEGRSYLGFIFARAGDAARRRSGAARRARQLRFVIDEKTPW